MRFRVRAAKQADKANWRHLWQSYCDFYSVVIPSEVTATLWQRIMDAGSLVNAIVAEQHPAKPGPKAGLLGFANYVLHPYTWGNGDICYLEDLFVAEKARGRGIGRGLIETLVQSAKGNGWPRVYWHTHEFNEPARSLYEQITPRDPFVRYAVHLP